MKIDPYNNQANYTEWKENTKEGYILGLSNQNKELLLRFLNDMEIGINVGHGSKKGARSFIRLISLRDKMLFIMKKVQELYVADE